MMFRWSIWSSLWVIIIYGLSPGRLCGGDAGVSSPTLDYPILFVVRHQYESDHHNTATLFQTGEINAHKFRGGSSIRTIDIARGGESKILLDLPDGVARDIEVSFDGSRILFSMRRNTADDYHIHEMLADGSGLKQLTFGSGISDIDPIYLPDDRILFASTREPKFCMCNRHIMCNLYTMDDDGANIQQIGHSTLFEGHPSLLPDGRIMYDRWEYIDRNFGDAQGVWVCNPDGTNHAIHWGNNTNSPGAVLDNRSVPGTEFFIGTFSSCHDRPWGALALVNRNLGLDGRGPVVRTWPKNAIDLIGVGNYDTFKQVQPKYEDPYPISSTLLLCSRSTGKDEQMGIYLIDLEGGEKLLHTETPGCFDPMSLAPRNRPPVIPSRVELTQSVGTFYVVDVYLGMGMETIPRGSVKSLRVVESPEKRFWSSAGWDGGTGQQAPAMAWDDFNNKQILGTVPVEQDGSVYFEVPADRFVYFQLLDERGMMIQSMRSGTMVRPGETAGCVGCHEPRQTSVPNSRLLTAMRRSPKRLTPWYGPPRNFSYLAEVQPVFDRHCVSCHDYGTEAGKKLNLAGDLGLPFNTSYMALRRGNYVTVPGAGPYQTLLPRSWGADASRLTEILLDGHGDPEIDSQVKLEAESIDRIVTWIDINAPYYPEYASAYGSNRYGRSPLTESEMQRVQQLTGSIDVNFTRPRLSTALTKLPDPKDPIYAEALKIIETGRDRLAGRPRADMPKFRLIAENEVQQQAKYDAFKKMEATARQALLRGEKHYDAVLSGFGSNHQ